MNFSRTSVLGRRSFGRRTSVVPPPRIDDYLPPLPVSEQEEEMNRKVYVGFAIVVLVGLAAMFAFATFSNKAAGKRLWRDDPSPTHRTR